MRTVGEVSRLAGVSVRTLHHYDEVGLLVPSERSEAGYRLYAHGDLERLQEILAWRALGFPLAEIAALLDEPGRDRGRALRRQRELVGHELERLAGVRRALDAALAAHEAQTPQTEDEMFDGFDAAAYEDEVRERWGHTEAYRESARRAAGYGEEQWREIRAEAGAIVDDLAALMAAVHPAAGPEATAVAERHRRHISRWFYECSPQMHRGLAEMFVADERFRRTYEQVAEGLAAYFHDAILANAGARP